MDGLSTRQAVLQFVTPETAKLRRKLEKCNQW